MRKLLLLSIILIFVKNLNAQQFKLKIEDGFVSYRVVAKSFLLISHTIIGTNREISGELEVLEDKISGRIVIPVPGFESGNTRRDRDVARFLKYPEHENIFFEVVEISEDELKSLLEDKSGKVKLRGKLTVAGVSKIYDFNIKFQRMDDQLAVTVDEKEVRFTDFNIEPPAIQGFGPFSRVITSAPDQVFLTGKIIFKIIRSK
jgi:polyisoprenoid-binding protein YceI